MTHSNPQQSSRRISETSLIIRGADYDNVAGGYRIARGAAKGDIELRVRKDGSSRLQNAGGLQLGNVNNPAVAVRLAAAIASATAAPRVR